MTKQKSPASGARTFTGIASAVALVGMVASFQLSANAAEVESTSPVPLPAAPTLTPGSPATPAVEATPALGVVAPAVAEPAPTVDVAPEPAPPADAAPAPEAPAAVVAPDPAPAPAPAPVVDPAPAPAPVATTKAS